MQGLTLILDRKSSRDGPAGSKIVRGRVTSVGVFDYPSAGRRDVRKPEHVFAPKSIESLKGAPVTRLHPPGDMVDPTTIKDLAIGHIGDAIEVEPPKNGKHTGRGLLVDVYLTTADAIADWEAKQLAEASCGYDATLIEDAGEFEGAEFDHCQTEITYNHVALGPEGWGRQGENVRLLDSKDPPMKIIIDGKEFENETAAREFVQGQLASVRAELATEKSSHEKTKTALADAKDPKTIAAAVKARTDLLKTAKLVLIDGPDEGYDPTKWDPSKLNDEGKGEESPTKPTEEELADKDDKALKLAVIEKAGIKLPDNASADYIEGAYASAKATAEAKAAEAKTTATDAREGGSGLARIGFATEDEHKGGKTNKGRGKVADGSEELEAARAKAADHTGHKFAMSKT